MSFLFVQCPTKKTLPAFLKSFLTFNNPPWFYF